MKKEGIVKTKMPSDHYDSVLKFISEVVRKEIWQLKSSKRGMMQELGIWFESRMSDLKVKYPSLSSRLDLFSDVPPKYLEWIAKQLGASVEDQDEALKQTVLGFDNLVKQNKIPNKDIYGYKTIEDLKKSVDSGSMTMSATQQKKAEKAESKLVYEDDRYVIIQPLSMKASCHYGYGTKWCISAKEESDNYFKDYSGKGVQFYFVLDKSSKDPVHAKVAVALLPGGDYYEIYDAQDNRMTSSAFESLYPPEVLEALGKVVSPHATVRAEKLAAIINNGSAAHAKQTVDYLKELYDTEDTNMDILVVISMTNKDRLWLFYKVADTNPQIMQGVMERLTSTNTTLSDLIDLISLTKLYKMFSREVEPDLDDVWRSYYDNHLVGGLESIQDYKKVLDINKQLGMLYLTPMRRLKEAAVTAILQSLGIEVNSVTGPFLIKLANFWNSSGSWYKYAVTEYLQRKLNGDKPGIQELMNSLDIDLSDFDKIAEAIQSGKILFPMNGMIDSPILSQ